MTKKIGFFIFFAVLFAFRSHIALPVLGLAATPSSVATGSADDILNKITDKISKSNQIQKKSLSGKIRTLGKNSLTITADAGDIFFEINDATSFYRIRAGQKSTLEFKTLKVGDEVTGIGTLDPSSKTVTARQIVVKIRRIPVFGKVLDFNKKTAVVSLATPTASQSADLSTAVVLEKVDTKGNILTSKLTDITPGDFLAVIGYIDPDSPNIVSALKYVLLPQTLTMNTPTATPSGT